MSAPYRGGLKEMFFQNWVRLAGYHILHFLRLEAVGQLLKALDLALILPDSHRLLLDVQAFIHATLAVGVLLDGPWNHHSVQHLVVFPTRSPSLGRNHLSCHKGSTLTME